jgi:hypothetical protein
MLSYLFRICLTFARCAYTNLQAWLSRHRLTFPLPRLFQLRHLSRPFYTIAQPSHHHQKEHNNPLLRGPWLKAALGKVSASDLVTYIKLTVALF